MILLSWSLCHQSERRLFAGGFRRTDGFSVFHFRFPFHPCFCIRMHLCQGGGPAIEPDGCGALVPWREPSTSTSWRWKLFWSWRLFCLRCRVRVSFWWERTPRLSLIWGSRVAWSLVFPAVWRRTLFFGSSVILSPCQLSIFHGRMFWRTSSVIPTRSFWRNGPSCQGCSWQSTGSSDIPISICLPLGQMPSFLSTSRQYQIWWLGSRTPFCIFGTISQPTPFRRLLFFGRYCRECGFRQDSRTAHLGPPPPHSLHTLWWWKLGVFSLNDCLRLREWSGNDFHQWLQLWEGIRLVYHKKRMWY